MTAIPAILEADIFEVNELEEKMNCKYKISLTILLLVLVFLPQNVTLGQIEFKSVGLESGWYSPSLSFWNEDTFIKNWDDHHSGALFGKGFADDS